jgi:hypothetical protein
MLILYLKGNLLQMYSVLVTHLSTANKHAEQCMWRWVKEYSRMGVAVFYRVLTGFHIQATKETPQCGS